MGAENQTNIPEIKVEGATAVSATPNAKTSDDLTKFYEAQEGGMFGKVFGMMDSFKKAEGTATIAPVDTPQEQQAPQVKPTDLRQEYLDLKSLKPSGRHQVENVKEGLQLNLKNQVDQASKKVDSLWRDYGSLSNQRISGRQQAESKKQGLKENLEERISLIGDITKNLKELGELPTADKKEIKAQIESFRKEEEALQKNLKENFTKN